MKILIDGKEVKFEDNVKIIYEDEFIGMAGDAEIYGQLHVTMTSEGLIADVIEDGSADVDRTLAWQTEDLIEACI